MRVNVFGIVKGKETSLIVNVFEIGKKFIRFSIFDKDKEYVSQRLHEILDLKLEFNKVIIDLQIAPIECKANKPLTFKSHLQAKTQFDRENLIRLLDELN
jgi:hypothetical protein